MTDSKGLYWDYGLLLRSESVSIIRFLAFTTNVKQLRAPFCVPVIKHALLLPSAVLQSIFDSSTWKWNERAGPNLHLYMALIFLKTKYFSAEMEQPLSKETQKGTLFLLIIRATPVPPRNFLNRLGETERSQHRQLGPTLTQKINSKFPHKVKLFLECMNQHFLDKLLSSRAWTQSKR